VSQLALADVARIESEDVERHGVRARELLDVRVESRRWITASALETWLLEQGFAEPNGEPGRLVPTKRAIALAGAIDFLS
jgi:hypothetical protein